ncbi:MAG TPA: UvrD-helicase domain-containing protein, partial [Steroidobacteraceae bacterium]|nr:UvrD-helicase domain-containing protein [Steroidobacteraceae bacterium]
HPDQRALVERSFSGPARVSGSAGTGKTIVALHRAVHLARRATAGRVLLTTFSTALARALKFRLGHLIGNEPEVARRIDVEAINDVALCLYTARFGAPVITAEAGIHALIAQANPKLSAGSFTDKFLLGEWNDVVDAWNLQSWEEYRDVARLGRKTRIGGKQREALWAVFADVRASLASKSLVTWPALFAHLTAALAVGGERPYEAVVADEAQDFGVPQMRFLAALVSDRQDGLFFAGDLGQRIFQTPFSWKALGVDVRGRSSTLRINYRTAHQIRAQADRLLPQSIADVDGLVESRRGTISVFDTAPPQTEIFSNSETEAKGVAEWIAERRRDGYAPHEIGVFVRSDTELDRARRAVAQSGNDAVELGEAAVGAAGKVSIGTMHMANPENA